MNIEQFEKQMLETVPQELHWLAFPWVGAIKELERFEHFYRMSKFAIGVFHAGVPEILKQDPKYLRHDIGGWIEVAQVESKGGFPILARFYVISLWTTLESTLRDFVASWLQFRFQEVTSEVFKSLTINFVEYIQLPEDERGTFLLDCLDRHIKVTHKGGIARFETLLSTIGLGGKVHTTIEKNLLELASIRNCLVHSAGIADRQFVARCPWLGIAAGASIPITEEALDRYSRAVNNYMMTILVRLAEKRNVEVPPDIRKVVGG